jgi:hypothetical protein
MPVVFTFVHNGTHYMLSTRDGGLFARNSMVGAVDWLRSMYEGRRSLGATLHEAAYDIRAHDISGAIELFDDGAPLQGADPNAPEVAVMHIRNDLFGEVFGIECPSQEHAKTWHEQGVNLRNLDEHEVYDR